MSPSLPEVTNGEPAGFSRATLPSPGPEEMARLLAEIAAELDAAPEAFFAAYLERVLTATQGRGVALWSSDGRGGFQLLHQVRFGQSGLEPGTPEWACHLPLLQDAALRTQAFWVPPQGEAEAAPVKPEKGNFGRTALLLAPIFVDRQSVGTLVIAQEPALDRPAKRARAQLATRLAEFAAAYFQKGQRQAQLRQGLLWKELVALARQFHRSLDPREVAFVVANDGRKFLECDQVAVGLARGKRCRVGAVSGSLAVEPRGPLVKAMQRLLESVLASGEPLGYEGARDGDVPPAVAHALDEYLHLSNSTRLLALPLRRELTDTRERPCAVLLAESFGPTGELSQLRGRAELLAGHAGPALHNAQTHDRLPLRGLSAALGRFGDACQAGGVFRLTVLAGLVLAVAAALTLLQVPLRREATGQLVPAERRIVYAPLNGKVLRLAARHGDRVAKGQELLFLEDAETQLKVDQLAVKIGAAAQHLSLIEERLGKALERKEQSELLAERIKFRYEHRKAVVERDLLLSGARSPRQAPVHSPLSGQVISFDAREKLLGKEVKAGDPLLRVAAVDGVWEVEVAIPEREVSAIRAALLRSDAGVLDVDLLLGSDPQRTYRGKLTRDGLGGETIVRNDKVVLPARVAIADDALRAQLDGMPVGVEVHARVRCGHAPLGYVWTAELWDFLYERFLF